MTDSPDVSTTTALPGWAWLCIAFVAVAVLLELLGGSFSNSPVPEVAEKVAPIAWPPAARVVWWLAVAAAAAGYRWAERRAGIRRHPLVVALSVAPFLAFAYGVGTGASWSTWH